MKETKKRGTRAKVVPLKTTAQLRSDLVLLREENDALREANLNLVAEARSQAENFTMERDEERMRLNEERIRVSALLQDIHNIIKSEPELPGRMPVWTRVMATLFPASFNRKTVRATKARILARIVARMKEDIYQQHHETSEPKERRGHVVATTRILRG